MKHIKHTNEAFTIYKIENNIDDNLGSFNPKNYQVAYEFENEMQEDVLEMFRKKIKTTYGSNKKPPNSYVGVWWLLDRSDLEVIGLESELIGLISGKIIIILCKMFLLL